ncbi:MAG: PASTA domain-containing protein [Clostridiales bacterium]|nr:PASTA domain-containing protein [Clostridiales bacterium]
MKPDNDVKGRLLLILIAFMMATAGLGAKVAVLQFVEGDELSAMAYSQQRRGTSISPKRGAILDRNGDELAVNTSVTTITLNPSELQKSIAANGLSAASVAAELAAILDMDAESVQKKIEKSAQYEMLKKKAEAEAGERAIAYQKAAKLSGIYASEDSKRYYKNNNLAAHVIGMTGDDNQGLSGIEYVMEKDIKGTAGKIMGEVDIRNVEVPFQTGSRVDAQDGHNVTLTIDTTIQFFATQALEKAIADNDVREGGTIIVMDPQTAEVLAMVSKPDFNLNDPYAAPPGLDLDTDLGLDSDLGLEGGQWNGRSEEGVAILGQTVWRNKAIMDTYEPGSTFKAITTAAGLEDGAVTLESEFDCAPVTGYGPRPIRCWTTSGSHGRQDLTRAVYNSCNPAFMRIALSLGRDRFYSYVGDFGFYDKTGIVLPGEVKGIFHEKPSNVDMLVASFGQRFTITPMQLVTAYSAIANGGSLMKPMLVKELTDASGNVLTRYEPEVVRKVISKDTSDKLKTILEGVVSEGTGKNAYVSGYRVAGKTGTSETVDEDRFIASFCSFAPADSPKVCVLVMLDDPRGESHMGGAIAAPVAQRLIEEVLTYMEVERIYSERDQKSLVREISAPALARLPIEEAVAKLKELGMSYRLQAGIDDLSLPVAVQVPAADTGVAQNATFALYTDPQAERMLASMPNLSGKTVYEASDALARLGLNMRISGSGVAKGQSVAPGEDVEVGSTVDVAFRYTDNIE